MPKRRPKPTGLVAYPRPDPGLRAAATDALRRYMVRESVGTATLEPAVEASDKPWSQFSDADYDVAQYHHACVLHRHTGEATSKEQCSLPIREPSGALNRNGVHAAASRIGQVKDATAAQKKAAAKALVRAYKELDEDPPESVTSLTGEAAAAQDGHPERVAVREASVGGVTRSKPGRMMVRLIKAGISLNGNAYSPETLRVAARERAWPKGCQTFVDHASEEEERAQPSGSVKNLAGVLTEDARWDEASQSLIAEVQLFHPWRDTLTDMAEHIGMSIRAWISGEHGEYQGQECFVVNRIEEGRSVDFVTVPAAGGEIISVLEAVGNAVPVAEARNCGHWVEARIHAGFTEIADRMFGDGYLTREERITLSGAVGDALSAFAARVEQDAPHLYERDPWREPEPDEPVAAEVSAGPADDTAAEVVENVTDGTPPTAPNPSEEEPEMSGTQTGAPPVQAGTATVAGTPPATTSDDTTTAAGTAAQEAPRTDPAVTAALESITAQLAQMQERLTAETARADARDAENRRLRAEQAAREAVVAALAAPDLADVREAIAPRVTERILQACPVTDTGDVDTTRLAEAITAAITAEAGFVNSIRAQEAERNGYGLPRGLGGAPVVEEKDDGFEKEMTDFFANSLNMTTEAAAVAARGRG